MICWATPQLLPKKQHAFLHAKLAVVRVKHTKPQWTAKPSAPQAVLQLPPHVRHHRRIARHRRHRGHTMVVLVLPPHLVHLEFVEGTTVATQKAEVPDASIATPMETADNVIQDTPNEITNALLRLHRLTQAVKVDTLRAQTTTVSRGATFAMAITLVVLRCNVSVVDLFECSSCMPL